MGSGGEGWRALRSEAAGAFAWGAVEKKEGSVGGFYRRGAWGRRGEAVAAPGWPTGPQDLRQLDDIPWESRKICARRGEAVARAAGEEDTAAHLRAMVVHRPSRRAPACSTTPAACDGLDRPWRRCRRAPVHSAVLSGLG